MKGNRSTAVGLTGVAAVVRGPTDGSAAVTGDSDGALPFGEDRLTRCFGGVGGVHQAHKAEDDGLGDTHFADGDEVGEC